MEVALNSSNKLVAQISPLTKAKLKPTLETTINNALRKKEEIVPLKRRGQRKANLDDVIFTLC